MSKKSYKEEEETNEVGSHLKVSQASQKKSIKSRNQSRDQSPITSDLLLKLLSSQDEELLPKATPKKKTTDKPVSSSSSKAMKKVQQRKAPESGGLNALEGLSFVVTGIFDNADREEMIKFIKRLGGRVPGSVSKKTDYLIIGTHLERNDRPVTSTNKYKKADELNVPIFTEEQFEEFLRKQLKYPEFELARCMEELDYIANPEARNEEKKEQFEPPVTKRSFIPEESKRKEKGHDQSLPVLWVDKYKPQTAADLIGNRGVIMSLREWLDDWDLVHIHGQKKKPQFSRGMSYQQAAKINCKAALLSGPPGIGKTSAAVIIAKELGYDVNVTNASEKRNKNAVNTFIKTASFSTSIDAYYHKPSEAAPQIKMKKVIIMDEVDGMGGSDRGGIKALIQIIKETKTPIICICNDREHQKVRSLANHCYDLKFARPQKGQIVKRMVEIVRKETGTQPDKDQLENLVQSSGNDVRQVINSLQFCSSKTQGMKDTSVMLTGNHAAGKLLNYAGTENQTIKDKLDLFFVDYDLIPLLVQESYLRCFDEHSHSQNDLKALSRAADSISLGEVYSTAIRSEQEWQLLPNFGLAAAVAPPCFKAYTDDPNRGFIPAPSFPTWFGKNMTMRKNKRLISELRAVLSKRIQCGDFDMIQYVVPQLNRFIMESIDEPQKVLEILEYYGISIDMFKQHLMDLEYDQVTKSKFEKVGATDKRKLTTAYNNVHKQNFKQVKKKIVVDQDQGMPGEGDSDGEGSDESKEEEEEIKITGKAKKTVKRVAVVTKKKAPATRKKPAAKKRKNSFIDDDDSEMQFSEKKTKPTKKKGKKGKKAIETSSDDMFDF